MKFYTSCFKHFDDLEENDIAIATTYGGWPWWIFKYYKVPKGSFVLNKNNSVLGIWESKFSCLESFNKLSEKCEKNCPYKNKVPHCQFMDMYYDYLSSININDFLDEFKRIELEVKKIHNYNKETNIVLMVFESPDCPCAERPIIQKYFKDNGIEITEKTFNAENELIF